MCHKIPLYTISWSGAESGAEIMREKLTKKATEMSDVGKYGDGDGLWLHKRDVKKGKWILLVTVHGRRREMGLGAFPEVSLGEARLEADKWRAVIRKGLDPIKERQRQRREAERNLHILKDVAADAFESRKAGLKGEGKAGRWFSPVEHHILPKLGKVPVADIDAVDIRETLKPIWHSKADTARKAMNRLKLIMQHAAALGLDVDLQATDKAKALLGKQRHTVKHISALHWSDIPEFYESLNEQTVTHLALRLLILNGVRSRPLRFLELDHLNGDTWTIPGQLMKGTADAIADFRVPLSDEARKVIEQAKPLARDGFLFPSVRKGVISDATMARHMERRGMEARPHGFRSSLRDWIAEATDARHEVAETVLAHKVGTTVERSYRRTDYLEERRILMQRWADHVTGGTGRVIKLLQ